MQKKTVYLAGKITGDPFYRSKFYEAQKKLEDGGFMSSIRRYCLRSASRGKPICECRAQC